MKIRRRLVINRKTIDARRFLATSRSCGSRFPRAAEVPVSPLSRVTTLFPSNLRVATDSTPGSRTATVGVFVDVGSRFENMEFRGATHFLGRMMFKGTKTRNAQELREEIGKLVIGGRMNAFTSRERSGFHAKVLPQDVPLALDIFSDVLQNSIFDQDAITRERDVILGKNYEFDGQIQKFLFAHLHECAFPYSSLGGTVIGRVEKISRDHLLKYMSAHYTAPRMVIAASGAVDHDQMVDRVKKLFKNLPTQPTPPDDQLFEPGEFIGCDIQEARILSNNFPLAHFALAFEGASWKDPDSIGLMLIQSILGSWNKQDASAREQIGYDRAHKICKDELAESMETFNFNYKDTGMFGVYAVAKPDCLKDLAHAIILEIIKLRYQVTEDDVVRAQNKLKYYFLCEFGAGAEYIGHQLLSYGRRIPYAELFERIDYYNANQVKRVAHRFLYDSDIVVVGVGPCEGWPDRKWFMHMAHHPR